MYEFDAAGGGDGALEGGAEEDSGDAAVTDGVVERLP